MPLDRDRYAWATQDEIENELPNKSNPAPEVKLSGLKSSQPEPRGWYNWQMHELGEGLNLLEDEYTAADNTLQVNIGAEEAARISADDNLQAQIDAEEASRISADNSLQSDIDQEVSDRTTAVSNEQTARISADNNLQSQIDALTLTILQKIYPVGKLYVTKNATNPSTQLGFGVWSLIEGRTIIGFDSSDNSFDTIGEEGGSKSHTHSATTTTFTTTNTTVNNHVLTEAEMPSHTHRLYGTDASSASVEPLNGATVAGDTNGSGVYTNSGMGGNQLVEDTGGNQGHNHTASSSSASSSTTTMISESNLDPYHVAYIWERIS